MMTIDERIAEFARKDQEQLSSDLGKSAIVAHNVNPDKWAGNIKKARKRKIPRAMATPATEEPNPDNMNALISDFRKLKGVTAKHMSNPEFAKLNHDDIQNTSMLEGFINVFKGAGARINEGVNESLGAIDEILGLKQGAEAYKRGAEYWRARAEKYKSSGIASKVYKGIGAAPAGVAEFMAGVPYAVFKGGSEGYQKEGTTGAVKGALIESIKRYGIGKVFKGIEASPMSPIAKSTTMATTMGAQTAAEGGDIESIVAATVTGAALIPPKAKTKGEAIKARLLSKGVDTKIAEEIGHHADMVTSHETAGKIQDLVNTSKAAKLRTRDEDLFKEFVEDATEDSKPVIMPSDKFDDMISKQNIKPEDVMDNPELYYGAKYEGEKIELTPAEIAAMSDRITPENIKDMTIDGVPSLSELEAREASKAKEGKEPSPEMIRPAVQTSEGIKIGAEGDRHTDIIKDVAEEQRGFLTPEGEFISREQAAEWMKTNRPDLFEKLPEEQKTSLHSEGLWESQGIKTPEETAISRLAKRTEQAAIDLGLTEGFEDLPTSVKLKLKEQAEVVAKVIDKNFNDALSIAMGEKLAPAGSTPEAFYMAVKKIAEQNKDVDLIKKLATQSSIPLESTEMGRRLISLRGQDLFSPVKAVQEISEARKISTKETVKQQTERIGALEKEVAELQKSYEELVSKQETGQAFEKLREQALKGKKRAATKKALDAEYNALSKKLNNILNPNKLTAGVDPAAIPVLLDMARNRIQRGFLSLNDVVNSIYREVRKYVKNISKNDIKEALSGSKEEAQLKTELEDLKEVAKEKPELTDQQKIDRAMLSVERSIKELERRIAEKDITPKKKGAPVETPELKVLRTKRDALKAELDQMRKDARPPKDQLKGFKTRTENRIKELERRLGELDFAKKEKVALELTPEAKKLKEQLERKKAEYKAASEAKGEVTKQEVAMLAELSDNITKTKEAMEQGGNRLDYGAAQVEFENYVEHLKGVDAPIATLAKRRYNELKTIAADNIPKAVFEAAKSGLQTISETSIAMVASFDNSFLGRQGLKVLMTHPTAWKDGAIKSFSDFAKVMGGKEAMDALKADIYSRPNFVNGEYQKAKIIVIKEEQFPTTLPERIPGLGRVFKASEAAFTGSAMRMRADLYDMLSAKAKENGVDFTQKVEIESLGKVINSLTARGQWGERGEGAAVRLVLWAPKMLKANIDVITAHGFGSGLETKFARREAALNLFKITAEVGTLMAIANALMPGSAETDPRSADFGKIKVGDTRFDITGGAASIVTLGARIATRSSKSSTSGIVSEYGIEYGKRTPFDALIDFMVNKSAPPARVAIDLLRGKDFEGEPFEWSKEAFKSFTPISLQNAIKLKDDASAEKVLGVMVDFIGLNANTYDEDTKQKRDIISRLRKGKDLTPAQMEIFDNMTPEKQDKLIDESYMTAKQAGFSKLSMEAMTYAWKSMGEDERDEVRDIYTTKINKYFQKEGLSAEESDKMQTKIDEAEGNK